MEQQDFMPCNGLTQDEDEVVTTLHSETSMASILPPKKLQEKIEPSNLLLQPEDKDLHSFEVRRKANIKTFLVVALVLLFFLWAVIGMAQLLVTGQSSVLSCGVGVIIGTKFKDLTDDLHF